MSGKIILSGRNITRHYQGKGSLFRAGETVKAIKGVDFDLHEGETLAIVGESGCGKSTLARILTLIDRQTSGDLTIEGETIDIVAKAVTPELRQKVQMVFQDPYGSLNPRKTIATMLEEPLLVNTDMDKAARRAAALDMIAKVGLMPEHADRYPHMFSGGQRQRVAIARALMLNPKILILDEPVSALDLSVQAQILNLLADLQKEFNLSYIFISHDLSVVKHICDRVMVMYFGEFVESGTRDDVFSNPQHDYTKKLFAATPSADPAKIRARLQRAGVLAAE